MFDQTYTVDGVHFFDTMAAMNASLEEDRGVCDKNEAPLEKTIVEVHMFTLMM